MKERARGTLDDMKHLACDVAGGNRVLLVLDDVWDWSWAKELDFIARPSSVRILVTTRKEGILRSLDAKAFPVHQLSMDESKKMFWKFAFGVHDPQPSDPDVVGFAEEIAQKCEGLPLALEVIGSAMAVHRREGPLVWEERYKRLHLSNDPDVEKQMFKRLKFSYDELGNYEGEKLQEWFLYVAAFPEDEEIEFTDLRKCWMEVGSELSPTAIVNELERRCLVKINKSWNDDDRIIVHDMLRKLCIRILKGKYGPQQEHEKGCLFGYDWTIGIRDATFAEVSFISKNVGSFLSDNHVGDVLLLEKCEGLSNVDDSFINHIQGVKVLSLWRCSKMRFIPESISKLKNLQVLDIQGTEVSELPDALFSLTSLKYLKCTTRWMPMKCNIALLPQLSNLEELGLNVSSKEDSSVLDLTGISHSIDFASVVGRWQLINLTHRTGWRGNFYTNDSETNATQNVGNETGQLHNSQWPLKGKTVMAYLAASEHPFGSSTGFPVSRVTCIRRWLYDSQQGFSLFIFCSTVASDQFLGQHASRSQIQQRFCLFSLWTSNGISLSTSHMLGVRSKFVRNESDHAEIIDC
ncbi:probable disease resistance protein At1g61190 [Selaginella moellendorffii]|uniref:probable disease resistance protein At1g61190 n=1 Tax=Selaginella moellendorffii TaxID=88036 RepID=UPI000D1C7115|nr:probable disease resistance protein At1g61190 [Selaginella moellendorffii]|eukprot:XP_024544298.1 probable disease resistance protein At1g61190 [Selaginella moellendorffii]